MAEKTMERDAPAQSTRDSGLARRQSMGSPFTLMHRFADEMDRMFGDIGRGWLSPRHRGGWLGATGRGSDWDLWSPDVEVFQRGDQVVIRVDLPGLSKEDVKIEIADDTLTIEGERQREYEDERGGVYRSERSYGSFVRTISLPEGALTDQAKATFRDGVLEITMPAPPERSKQGRRLEITEGASQSRR
jgi:HSP20 family protein